MTTCISRMYSRRHHMLFSFCTYTRHNSNIQEEGCDMYIRTSNFPVHWCVKPDIDDHELIKFVFCRKIKYFGTCIFINHPKLFWNLSQIITVNVLTAAPFSFIFNLISIVCNNNLEMGNIIVI